MESRRLNFEQALSQLVEMYRCLAFVYDGVFPRNPDSFGLLAEGDLEHIRQLEATVAELGGRRAAEAFELRHWGGPPAKHTRQDPSV